jgi:hypothetical protein
MQSDIFYQKLSTIGTQAPDERYRSLAELHSETFNHYLALIGKVTPAAAAQMVGDGRTVTQMVGHIAEWDRTTLIAMGEVLADVKWPRLMSQTWAMAPDGQVLEFAGVDEFNAYFAGQHAAQPWETIRDLSIELATTLYRLFRSELVTPERLEQTRPHRWKLGSGQTLTLPCGWYLWGVTVEHIALEHINDLEQVTQA